jgi:hypothetical protein
VDASARPASSYGGLSHALPTRPCDGWQPIECPGAVLDQRATIPRALAPLPWRLGGATAHKHELTALLNLPHVALMPPWAACQGGRGLVAPARRVRGIPEAPAAVVGSTENGGNGGHRCGGGPPTNSLGPVAAAYRAPARFLTNGSRPPERVVSARSTACATTSSCCHAMPTPSGALGPSLPRSCGACCVSDCAGGVAACFLNTRATCQRTR